MIAALPFRSIGVLTLCQALAMTCSAMVISVTALVGRQLAPDPSLATLPLALQFLGLMASTAPASFFMSRRGRRAGFSVGAFVGAVGGLLGVQAILSGSFALYCGAAALTGAFLAHAMYYRFAAADVVSAGQRGRAIAIVMAGGVLAAVAGPQLANWSRGLVGAELFAGVYLVIAGLCAAQMIAIQFAELPRPRPEERREGGRRLSQLLRQPALPTAILCGMVGYGAMNLVMTVTPPAMADCHIDFTSTAFAIQWHVFAMYAPSFVTGQLVHRFGVRRVIAVGGAMMLACVAVNLTGNDLLRFVSGLVLLGCGWNFMFVGATTWITQLHEPAEKAGVQALNEVLVFGTVAVTALGSGWVYATLGWQAVNLAIVGPVLLALGAVAMVGRHRELPDLKSGSAA